MTRLRVRHWRFLPEFLFLAIRSSRQTSQAAGILGKSLLNEPAWQNEPSMRAFMLAGVRRKAMPKLIDWCDEASLVHWTQDARNCLHWTEAHRRLLAEGRRSKIHHPSPAHEAFEIPAPRAAG